MKKIFSQIEQGYDALLKNTLRFLPITTLVGLLISICMFFISDLPKLQLAANAKNWPTVKARVTKSALAAEARPDSKAMKDLPKTLFSAHIEYDYTVNGKNYHSSRISIDGWGNRKTFSGKDDYEKIVKKFSKVSTIDAYYDPANPSYSVLMPGVDLYSQVISWLGIFALILFLGASLYFLCLVLYKLPHDSIKNISLALLISTIIYLGLFLLLGIYLVMAIYIGELEILKLFVPHTWLMD